MKSSFLSIFKIAVLTLFTPAFGQNQQQEIIGNWVKVKTEMKDGSKLFSRFEEESSFVEFRIDMQQICTNSHPVHNRNEYCLDYTFSNNFIKTSPLSGYMVESLTDDFLVLCEAISDVTDDKLKRVYLIKEQAAKSVYEEKLTGKQNIVADQWYTPKSSFPVEIALNKAFKNNYSNLRLMGTMRIFPAVKKIETKVTCSTKADSARIQLIKKVMNDSFSIWNLKGFEAYESIDMPFSLCSRLEDGFRGIRVQFFTQDINQFDLVSGGSVENVRRANELYKKGLKAYQEKRFVTAVSFFNESFKLDPKNLDALYNKATVLYEMGDKNNACLVLKQLVDFGQVNGLKLFLKYCSD